MFKLRELIPDAKSLVEMSPSDLAGYVLESLLKEERQFLNRRNFCSYAAQSYSPNYQNYGAAPGVAAACAAAWSWLETNGLICRDPEHDNDWYMLTKLGTQIGSQESVRLLVERSQLPAQFLHQEFARDVIPLFYQNRFDTAVFEAFHTLEVSIRSAAGLGNDLIGTKLASRAFDPQDGPLTDTAAEGGERQALMNLMCGAIGSYKNPQSHRHVGLEAGEAREMIMLASHLLRILDARRTRKLSADRDTHKAGEKLFTEPLGAG